MRQVGERTLNNYSTSQQNAECGEVYDIGALHIERDGYYVEFEGQPIYGLARKEFLLLARLAKDAGRVVSPEQLWAAAWGEQAEFNNHTLRVHIAYLRRQLTPYGVKISIKNMSGLGYRLVVAESQAAEEFSATSPDSSS
jgi:DNA-binding response OmpR family regulator